MSTHPNSPASAAPQPRAASAASTFGNIFAKPIPIDELDAHVVTPTQGSGPSSLADLTQLMQTLITTTQTLAISMQGLVNKLNGNHPRSVVKKPQPFKGNGSENARVFQSAFMVFAQDQEREFSLYGSNGQPVQDVNGEQLANQKKLMTSFLTYMQDEAAVWACPQLELLAEGKEVFNDCFADCLEAFKLKRDLEN
jgi:hypothetical protein